MSNDTTSQVLARGSRHLRGRRPDLAWSSASWWSMGAVVLHFARLGVPARTYDEPLCPVGVALCPPRRLGAGDRWTARRDCRQLRAPALREVPVRGRPGLRRWRIDHGNPCGVSWPPCSRRSRSGCGCTGPPAPLIGLAAATCVCFPTDRGHLGSSARTVRDARPRRRTDVHPRDLDVVGLVATGSSRPVATGTGLRAADRPSAASKLNAPLAVVGPAVLILALDPAAAIWPS